MNRCLVVLGALLLTAGCSPIVQKQFKVFAEPTDAVITVTSGVELKEQKFRSPASITVQQPKDPALAQKSLLEISRENYVTRTVKLDSIRDGETLNIKLEKVLKDLVRYKLSYRLIGPKPSADLQFRDAIVSVSFAVNDQGFQMRFENISPRDMKILWERAEYTDVNKKTFRIMHSGIRFQDRNNPLPDQHIAARSTVQETVIPVKNIFVSQQKQAYEIRPLFPVDSDAAAGLKGKTINLFIPVEYDRQIIPYNFKIQIVDSVKEAGKG